jgi:pimeloyl-ACP methyl ester carboxylesterase
MSLFNDKTIGLIKKSLLISGLIFIILGVFITIHFNFTLLAAKERHFQITSDENFRSWGDIIEIDCVLYTPNPEYDVYDKRPAVVFAHGFISDNLYLRGYANELCKRGFVSICISARGHAGSSGQFGLTWENETLSTVKWLRDNADYYNIDTNKIGIMGHSMGAFSVVIAAIIDGLLGNNWIDSTIAIGGPFYNATSDIGFFAKLGVSIPENIDSLAEKFQQYFYPTATGNFKDQFFNLIIEGRLDESETKIPRNFLQLDGEFDEIFEVESAYQLVWNFGRAAIFGTSDYTQIQPSKTYGDFNDGSARRLVILPGEHHATEGTNLEAVVEMVDWFETSMKLKSDTNYPGSLEQSGITAQFRTIPVTLAAIGLIMVLVPSSIYLSEWLKNKDFKAEASRNLNQRQKYIQFGIYAGVYAGLSALVMPLILVFNLQQIIVGDFMVTSFFATFMVTQALLLIPAVIVLAIWENKKFNEGLEDFGIDPKYAGKAFLYGLSLFLILFMSLVFVGTYNLKNMVPYRIFGFFEMFLFWFLYLLVHGVIQHGFVQNKLIPEESEKGSPISDLKELVKSSIINGIIQGIGVGIFATMFLMDFGIGGIVSIVLIPVCVVLLSGQAFLMSLFYMRIRNVVGTAILGALLFAFICAVMLPSIYNAGLIVFNIS